MKNAKARKVYSMFSKSSMKFQCFIKNESWSAKKYPKKGAPKILTFAIRDFLVFSNLKQMVSISILAITRSVSLDHKKSLHCEAYSEQRRIFVFYRRETFF
jgi:hypothetical protein